MEIAFFAGDVYIQVKNKTLALYSDGKQQTLDQLPRAYATTWKDFPVTPEEILEALRLTLVEIRRKMYV